MLHASGRKYNLNANAKVGQFTLVLVRRKKKERKNM